MPSRDRASRAAVWLLFFLSGATSLVYEVLWLRQLILIFGSTVFATSAILSTFMGGLALGAFLAGRLADRAALRPLRVYGWLEIGIGLYALAVPFLLGTLSPLYGRLWGLGASESFLMLSLAKFAGIAVVLLPPTILMGATLPVLARQVARDPQQIAGSVGALYAFNTVGAVAGTFVAGFVAIPRFGVLSSLRMTAAASILLGLGAWWLQASQRAEPSAGRLPAGDGVLQPIGSSGRLALLLFGLSGFGAMALEVAWTRAMGLMLGSSVYAFSIMLLAFLLGLAGGSAALSRWLRRRPGLDPGILLAALLGATGLLAWASACVLPALPRVLAEIVFRLSPGPNQWFAFEFALAFLVMFPATFALGGVFPVVLHLLPRKVDRVSRSVGMAYASNALGTIFGATAGGFLLVPWLGVRDTVIAVAVLELALGTLAAALLPARVPALRTAVAACLALCGVAVAAFRPGWNVLLMNSGVYMNAQSFADRGWDAFYDHSVRDIRLLYAREGLTASVVVGEQPWGNRYLSVNGKVEASTQEDLETQVMAGHLPLLQHPDPQDVMLIGLASGISLGAITSHPVRSIRVVEIEAAMLGAARLFSGANRGALDDPRVTISINDARNELQFSGRTYDVIVSEPSNPWMTVASNLFTEDFFRIARSRLRADGVFAQWLQTYCLAPDDMRSVIAAFRSVFSHVHVYRTMEGSDLLLVGSAHALRLDLARLDERISELQVRMSLATVGVYEPVDLLPLFVLGEDEVDRLVANAPRNTDDNARVEFSAPKMLYADTVDTNNALLEAFGADPFAYLARPPASPDSLDRLRLDLARAWLARDEKDRARRLAQAAGNGDLEAEATRFLRANGLL